MEITYFYYNEKGFINNFKKNRELYAEEFAKFINSDNKLRTLTTFVIANGLMLQKALASTNDAISKIDIAGNTFLGITRSFTYWLCIILCIIDIIKGLMQGDTKSIGKTIFKYTLVFATAYFLPWLFNIIKDIFQ